MSVPDVPGAATADVAGERLVLLPDRAAYWAAASTLLVADPHFGKPAAFRAAGVFVPRGTTAHSLGRLGALLAATGARRLVFLGDFLHAREGRHAETLAAIERWRGAHAETEMVLVRGNHDARAGDPSEGMRIACVDGPVREGPFALAHHPGAVDGAYVLAGHVHPGVVLTGAGRQRERLPCFWFGPACAVLPAFGAFTGLEAIAPAPGDRVWVVAGDEVVAVIGDR